MKKNKTVIIVAALSVPVIAAIVLVKSLQEPVRKWLQERITPDKVEYCGPAIKYARVFRDNQNLHIEAAMERGLEEIPETRESVRKMKRELREISTCADYKVMPMSHSVPYLRPRAAKELRAIGKAFRESLEAKGLPDYRIIVTSALRTNEDVAALRKINVNSTANSAHSYGTTFDIWYAKYDRLSVLDELDQSELRKVLAEVLKAEREAERIWVKYEQKQHCFHITVR